MVKYKNVVLTCLFLTPLTISGAPKGMPKDAWLKSFMPAEVAWHCNDAKSPIKKDFKGSAAECNSKVTQLFVSCTTSVKNVSIPDVLVSRQEAIKYGSIVGECIGAYYFGGDHLKMFNAAQQKT